MSGEVLHRRGRGAALSPPNRFDGVHVELDPAELEEEERRSVPTRYLRDATKSVLSANNSPDVPFTYSLNPYRGCEHGCSYCLDGETRILLANGSTKALREIQVGEVISGTVRRGRYRHLVRTHVLDHWSTLKKAYRVTLEDRTSLIASGDHRFLTNRGWKFVIGNMGGSARRPYLTARNRLLAFGADAAPRWLGVSTIEVLEQRELFDITTGTGDFIANGVVSHNCYARPSHEYLGFSAGLDFETKIVVKNDAARLLARQFESPSWEPQIIALSGNTDPYQPVERRLGITRACLEVFRDYRNPVGIITKNHLVTRDLDILSEMAALDLVSVNVSVTSLKDEVIGKMEPRTSRPARRLDAIRALSEAGVPVGVLVAPVVPGLTDEEMPAILEAAREAGAIRAAYIVLRLPGAVVPIFNEWLDREYPLRAEKVRSRIASLRGGRMYDPSFQIRMTGRGSWAKLFRSLFKMTTERLGMNQSRPPLATHHFRRSQGELFQESVQERPPS